MKIVQKGHVYALDYRTPDGKITPNAAMLRFVNLEPGTEAAGTTTQEAIRALIDRTIYCDSCLPWDGNKQAVQHLRMALALHEARALLRKTEKGLPIERIALDNDGHLLLTQNPAPERATDWNEARETQTGSIDPGVPCHEREAIPAFLRPAAA